MEKEEREKTAKILSNIFQKLNVNAKVEIAKDKADGLNLIVDNSYEFDEFEPTSLIEVANEIKNTAENYDWEEERSLWTPGENGAPEEPYLTEELKNIGHIMEDTRWAMEALLEIEQSQDKSYENKERIIKKYKRIIHTIYIFRKKCHIIIPAFKNFGLNNNEINDEILNIAKREVG